MQFEATDESGISRVEGFYQINDSAIAGPVLLNDAGENGDQVASNGMWSGYLGELNLGDTATSYCQVTDTDGNTVMMDATAYTVFPYHNVGNVTLIMTEQGVLGGSDFGLQTDAQGYWPRANGHDYLWYGGLWVGSDVAGEKRVMQTGLPYRSDWQPTAGNQITVSTRVSDQDISMHYDDLNTPRLDEHQPIGLEIHQESFQWADSTKDDFIIFRYTLLNAGSNGDLQNVIVALYMNLGVHLDNPRFGFGRIDDMVGFDADRNLFYMFDAESDPGTYVGVKILSDNELLTVVTDYNFDLETDDGYYAFISDVNPVPTQPREADLILLSTRLSRLAAGGSATIAFGLVFGENLAAMQANAHAMDAVFKTLDFPTSVDNELADGLPQSYALRQNYPNPFNPGTQISFDLPKPGQVEVSIFNISGQLVKRLINGTYQAGSHAVVWGGSDVQGKTVASGLYFYTIQATDFVQTKKMVKLR